MMMSEKILRVNSCARRVLHFVMLAVLAVAVAGGIGAAGAQQSDIGDFDIGKVRQAALASDTAAASAQSAQAPVEREHVFSVVVRIVLYLFVVILLIFAIAWFFRRQGLNSLRGGTGAMDIIETLPLGQNRMLVMVRVMDELFLLSHTASSVTLIEKIGGQKALDIIASSKGGGTMLHFKDALNSFMGKMKKNV